MPNFQATFCIRILEQEHFCVQVVAALSLFYISSHLTCILGASNRGRWSFGWVGIGAGILFGAFDRYVCHLFVISLAIIAPEVNGVVFSSLALLQARAAHECAYCASMPHGNELARNGTMWRLHMSTSARKRANNPNNSLYLHCTIM